MDTESLKRMSDNNKFDTRYFCDVQEVLVELFKKCLIN